MSKEFKTIGELVAILESRGVATDDQTAPAIERESYYAIVNGYKGPFLDRDAMQSSSGDVYKDGTRFRWIYDLFLFDRDLRAVTFRYLARAEAAMKTAVAYSFCEAHGGGSSYLERSNFCNADGYLVPKLFQGSKSKERNENLSRLMVALENKASGKGARKPFVDHYLKAYGFVPLWVLSNDLTFGNIVNFYQLMKPEERRRVCSTLARGAAWESKSRGVLSERHLLRAAKVANAFRNLCAHDDRLYCAREESASYADMLDLLAAFLPKDERNELAEEIDNLIGFYRDRFQGVTSHEILAAMGFDGDDS